jgi:alkanesulfonate monooxygenase SsuD/methylene tetrahydromethanopterin reductase-like flavin-dependent oxidoreductase (luciferase family)
LGDGWVGAGSSAAADFPEQLRIVAHALHEAGRDPGAFRIGKRVYVAVEDTERRARDRLTPILDGMYDAPGLTERVAVCGPPEASAEQLHELVSAGAQELLLHPMYDHLAQLEALASVAALVRDD